ncbi:unnamed protein product [Camellia sinensis]
MEQIQNGAPFVVIYKTTNPRDGNPALLIQDDGGGMDPETIRRCMSFGFSDKKMKSAIGQYGSGFKTSSMRLGADVIVFTCHLRERTLTQSVGLLSYTFLRQTGHDRIVVPLVDYGFNESTTKLEPILSYGQEHFSSNLSVLLQWSPYPTEEIMLKQGTARNSHFDDIGNHGTKIVIYNLWLNDNGDMELDFDLDAEDIRVIADPKLLQTGCRPNQAVPFWRVVKETTSSRGRGIVGVLEANFAEPTLNKQDFEKTSLFQKFEARLKEMTLEYWNFHCGLIGYQQMKKSPPAPKPSQEPRSFRAHSFIEQPVLLNHRSSVTDNAGPLSSAVESFEDTVATPSKRKEQNPAGELEHVKRHTGSRSYSTDTQHSGVNQPTPEHENQLQDNKFASLMQENEKLQTQLLELERSEECLTLMLCLVEGFGEGFGKRNGNAVQQLRKELGDIQSEYARLVAESESMNIVKDEKTING